MFGVVDAMTTADGVPKVVLAVVKPSWIVQVPAWATGDIELLVLTPGGDTVAKYPSTTATPHDDGWLAFDLSALDQTATLVLELQADGVCVLPPVQIGMPVMSAKAAASVAPTDDAYALHSLVRSPDGTA
jgi:hypothetical protein